MRILIARLNRLPFAKPVLLRVAAGVAGRATASVLMMVTRMIRSADRVLIMG
jgi:hypothetical protein